MKRPYRLLAVGVAVVSVAWFWSHDQTTHHPPASAPTTAPTWTKEKLKAFAFDNYDADEIQHECLDTLWTIESHWNYKAQGARTSKGRAFGIPQALPGDKMSNQGQDWKTNPETQILWGIRYIKVRYHNKACLALKYELVRGWY